MVECNSCILILCFLKIFGIEKCVVVSYNLFEYEYKLRGFSWNIYICIFCIFYVFGFN